MLVTTDARRKTPAQKAKTAAARIERASARRRTAQWQEAALAATSAGNPLNIALTLTWKSLEKGYTRRGHIQAMKQAAREKRLWAELRMVAARAHVPFLAARSPEHDKTRGLHLHLSLHLPNSAAVKDVIDTIGRLTGAFAVWVDIRDRTLRSGGRATRGVVWWQSLSAAVG